MATASKRTAATKRKANRAKVSAHRARMRAQGMRLLQIWVPDTRSPEFAKEARRQSRMAARSRYAKDDQAFVDSLSSWFWEGE
ncbi:MAG: antitoxin MazE family protein [Alphaproteobacteria bacterium]